MTALLVRIDFEDESDFDYFRPRFVGACEAVAEVALNGDEATGEPARADGTIEVSWETDDD